VDPLLALGRAHRWFWGLVLIAIVLVGALSRVLAAKASPVTGLALAVVATLLALMVAQLCRLMLAIGRVTQTPSYFRGWFHRLPRKRVTSS
jgi:uncharacterized protein HemY